MNQIEKKPFYVTFLVRYDSESDVPGVASNTEVLGGKMIGVSFTDMFAELESLTVNSLPPAPEYGGMIVLPRELTAENGAKALLIGEFFTTHKRGNEVPVSWTAIKEIYAKIVDHYGSPPPPAVSRSVDLTESNVYERALASLDLKTLEHIKLMFEVHSDHSTQCNGYLSLCRKIDEVKSSTPTVPVGSTGRRDDKYANVHPIGEPQ